MESRVVNDLNSLNEVIDFLRRNKLPHQDLRIDDSLFVSYHDETGNIIGSGGLEFYTTFALLRSVAVSESHRGRKVGAEIVNDLLERAKTNSVRELYLLTETAQAFFLKRGFADIARNDVPEKIKTSSEFSSVCPASATCMVYQFQ